MEYPEIKENAARITAELERISGGRTKLLAATKTVDPDRIAYAVNECGIKYIGENRVQELLEKYEAVKDLPCEIHFIGTLQRNKVKYIIDKVSLIHSVDSISLAEQIGREAVKRGLVMNVLCEVNIGYEQNKSGFLPEEVPEAFDRILQIDGVRPLGLMTMAPICENNEKYSEFFNKTYRLFIDNCVKKIDNRYEPVLSMGMSSSYAAAAACGSGMVRVGSAIFGQRIKK